MVLRVRYGVETASFMVEAGKEDTWSPTGNINSRSVDDQASCYLQLLVGKLSVCV